MYILVTYDIETKNNEGQQRLRKIAKCCRNYGQRVQSSVFECEVTPSQLLSLKHQLISIIDKNVDSIRIYHMGNNYHSKIERIGVETAIDIQGDLII
ncbi:MAG: CRISPR-associated endonuclease Cas2 [Bacteroidales bacterium]|nr:CRISPR-associated endonuclease Cas2 [Bacteroidales bacterium]